jgi:epoxide hydrolase 4
MTPILLAACLQASDIESRVTHGYADSNGVKIHYASLGQGPLVVMIHGFPDFWYTWRDQMEALSDKFQCVAIDQRGYNLSDKPKGKEKAIVVGHDWGGMVAWQLALNVPQVTEKLVILNLPHPRGLSRELANNPAQQKNSQYARNFQQPDAASKLTAEGLAFWVKDPEARKKYVEAFKRSDFEAMLNYYKRNYPREPYVEDKSPVVKTQMPVLMIHGLGDTALLSGALNNTWDWMGQDLTLVTIPGSSHFVQQDASELVSKSIRMWLLR